MGHPLAFWSSWASAQSFGSFLEATAAFFYHLLCTGIGQADVRRHAIGFSAHGGHTGFAKEVGNQVGVGRYQRAVGSALTKQAGDIDEGVEGTVRWGTADARDLLEQFQYPLEGYREKCGTDVVLGTRFAKKPIHLKIPVTIAGMSFGALSANAKECLVDARAGDVPVI